MSAAPPALPADGLSAPDVLAELRANRHDDADWRNGRIFGLIFHPDDDELEEVDDEVVVVFPGSAPDSPQAVRDSARASPAAYEIGTRSVIFITNPSLSNAI